MTGPDPLFLPAGAGGYRPTGYSRGPWDPDQLHGGAVGALLAEVLQDGLEPSFPPARLTVDLVRPVPRTDLSVEVEVVRDGRRLHARRAVLAADGKTVAVASLLALRETPLPPHDEEAPTPTDGPGQGVARWADTDEAFLGGALTLRFVPDEAGEEDLAAWVRLHRPVLPAVAASPLARLAAAADITSVVTVFEGRRRAGVGFLNADFSIHVHRAPAGEWIRIASLSRWEPNGIGTVTARLADEVGSLGQVTQALLLAPGLAPH